MLTTVLSVFSIVLTVPTVLTTVLTVLYRCKPSVPMSKQVLVAVWRTKSLSMWLTSGRPGCGLIIRIQPIVKPAQF